MSIWLRLAVKEITNNRRFSLLFIINLAIGLMGFIALNSFNHSLHAYLEDNLKKILTADFLVSSNRPFSPEANAVLDEITGESKTESRQISFLSMAAGPAYSRLARIAAMDVNYPLYGRIMLQGDRRGGPDSIQAHLMDKPGVWMSVNTAASLGVQKGDTIQLGQKTFYVADLIQEDPESAISNFEIAPLLYIGLDQLEGTQLIRFGSHVDYTIFYGFPAGTDIQAIIQDLKKAMAGRPDLFFTVEVIDQDRVSQRVGRAVNYFTGYMGLIGLVALFLSGIGAGYLFRGYLEKNLKQIAILMSLGANRVEAYIMFFSQVILLGIIASISASVLSFLVLPVFPRIFHGLLPPDLTVQADIYSLSLALLLGALGSVMFCLPAVIRIHQLKPLHILKGYGPAKARSRRMLYLRAAAFLPAILGFWILTVDQVNAVGKGTLFLAGFLCAALVLGLAGWLLMKGSRVLSHTPRIVWKISLRNIHRNRVTSVSCFLTIALGTYLLTLGPQLKSGLEQEVNRPKGLMIPGFFLIDIQPEQVEPLRAFLEDKGHPLANVSPFISGEIKKVNGEDLAQWVDQMEEGRGPRRANREFNFSYRADLSSSERMIQGRPLSHQPYDFAAGEPAEISLAESFADRYGLGIHDVLEFDIQGIPILGKVVNIREVRWNSFQPNFFILFQLGVLEDAPKTFLASIPQMPEAEKLSLQNAVVAEFPNISMIDVSRMVENILTITDRISFSMKFMAYLSIFAGLIVIFSIARQETQSRLWEINLLKVLGAGFRDVRSIILLEFSILGFMAAFTAVILSIISSYIISFYYFDRLWSFRVDHNLFSILAVTAVCALTAFTAAGKIIRQKPLSILQAV
ncbi:MAG: ABC transporter permease [Deltaproteobacteria bacterium]|nr:ABC transporter permease [Deltaproteobacteria bacterium]